MIECLEHNLVYFALFNYCSKIVNVGQDLNAENKLILCTALFFKWLLIPKRENYVQST